VAGLKDLNEEPDLFAYAVAGKSTQAVTRRAADLPSLSAALGGEAGDLSADGRFVAFVSASSHLVPGQIDTNGKEDVFLYDRTTRTALLVSRTRASAVTAATGRSLHPAVSADGRYVAFSSDARNLVPGANPTGVRSLFLFDRTTGAVSLVARTGIEPDVRMSPDGRWLVFSSTGPDFAPGQLGQIFLWDRTTGALALVSRSAAGPAVTGNDSSFAPVVSADGRYVAFDSFATDLVAGQTGDRPNLFLWDRVSGTTTLVSHAPDSALTGAGLDVIAERPAISADGRFLVFGSEAGDLDPGSPSPRLFPSLYLYDRTLGTFQWLGDYSFLAQPRLSADGRFVAFVSELPLVPGILVGSPQIYLYDRAARTVSLLTRPSAPNGYASSGNAQDPAISADGRYVAFTSDADDLITGLTPTPDPAQNLYLYDRTAGTLTLISHARTSPLAAVGGAAKPVISASGRQIAFTSAADFAPGDLNRLPDAYVFSLDPSTPPGPVTLPPCNLFSGSLRSNVRKTLTVAGACGVPAGARQVMVKLTVSQGTGKGNVQIYPGNVTNPSAGILRFNRGASRSAGFTVSLGNGGIALLPFVNGNGTVRVAVEVDGYVP
jgi:Tol biopolymer transport system component